MFLLKVVYKPFVLLFFLLFNFTVGIMRLLAMLGAFFWGWFILLIIAMLVYTAIHQQWIEFTIAFCMGFASYIGASIVLGLGFMVDWLNEKIFQLLMA